MNREIENIVNVLPVIRQLFERDVFITVMDDEGIVCGYSIPDGCKPLLQVGEKFEDPSGGFDEVMRTGRRKFNCLPQEIMGEAFEGYLVPVKDNGSVVGCLTCTYSVGDRERLGNIVDEFNNAAKLVKDKIGELVEEFDSLYGRFEEVSQMTNKVEGDINASEKIVGAIGSNASKSNILALNASIEAARSGEHGRGFAVVATEMGNLARDSSSSTAQIQKQLKEVHSSIDTMINSIKGTDMVAKNYNDQIKQIKELMDNMLGMAAEMEESFKR